MEYQYHPLDESRKEIQLLTLFPGLYHFPLRGRLGVCSLAKDYDKNKAPPPFEALSYHWGDPTPAASILIDGCKVPIAHNLDVALRHLRFLGQLRVLWVDAVCVNQNDVDDRNQHLLLMDAVYSRARQVVVWLGPGDFKTDAVMAAIGAKESQSILGAGPTSPLAPTSTSTASRQSPITPDPDGDVVDIDLRCILGRPWWRQLWAVQAFVQNTKDPLFVCGYKEAALPLLKLVINRYVERLGPEGGRIESDESDERGKKGDKDDAMASASYFLRLDLLRQEVQNKKSWAGFSISPAPLQPNEPNDMSGLFSDAYATAGLFDPPALDLDEIFQHSACFETADPRDKVYACLGLMKPTIRRALAPSYEKSTLQVYTDMAWQMLAVPRERFFSFFSFARLDSDDRVGSQNDKYNNWPSWVPDLSQCHKIAGTPRDPTAYIDLFKYCDQGPRRRPVSIHREVVKEEAVEKRRRFFGGNRSEPTISSRLICTVAGFVFDTVDTAVQLQSEGDLVRQIAGPLHDMAKAADEKPLPADHIFASLRRKSNLVLMIGGDIRRRGTSTKVTNILLREQAELYGVTLPAQFNVKDDKTDKNDGKDKDSKTDGLYLQRDKRWKFAHTRWFFTTKLGFTGICVEQVVDGDVVTLMPGERVPIVLRLQPRLSMVSSGTCVSTPTLYTVVGAAHVGATQCDGQATKMCKSKKLEKVVFNLV